jgi:hypothetical protein
VKEDAPFAVYALTYPAWDDLSAAIIMAGANGNDDDET